MNSVQVGSGPKLKITVALVKDEPVEIQWPPTVAVGSAARQIMGNGWMNRSRTGISIRRGEV